MLTKFRFSRALSNVYLSKRTTSLISLKNSGIRLRNSTNFRFQQIRTQTGQTDARSGNNDSSRGSSSRIGSLSFLSVVVFAGYGLFVWNFQEWFCANAILSASSKTQSTEYAFLRRESATLSRILTETPTSLTIVSGFDAERLILSTLSSNGLTSPSVKFYSWSSFNMPDIVMTLSEAFGISSSRYSLYLDRMAWKLSGNTSNWKEDCFKELNCTLRIISDALQLVEAERIAEESKILMQSTLTDNNNNIDEAPMKPKTVAASSDSIDFSSTWLSSLFLSKILPFSDVTLPTVNGRVARPVIHLNGLIDFIFDSYDERSSDGDVKLELLSRVLNWADDACRTRKLAHIVLDVSNNRHLLNMHYKLKKLPLNQFAFPITLVLNKDVSVIDAKFFIDNQVALSVTPQMHPSVYSMGLIVETIGNDLANLTCIVSSISRQLKLVGANAALTLTEDILDQWIVQEWRESVTSLWNILSSLRSDFIPPFVLSQMSTKIGDVDIDGMTHYMQALDCLLRVSNDEYVTIDDLVLNHLNGNHKLLALMIDNGLLCLDKTGDVHLLPVGSDAFGDGRSVELALPEMASLGSQISVCFPSKSRRRIMQLLFNCPVSIGDKSLTLSERVKRDIAHWQELNKSDFPSHVHSDKDISLTGLISFPANSGEKIDSFYDLICWLERERQLQREIIMQVLKQIQIPQLSPGCHSEQVVDRGIVANSVLLSLVQHHGQVLISDIQGIFAALGGFATQQDIALRLRSSNRSKPDFVGMFNKIDASSRHGIVNEN